MGKTFPLKRIYGICSGNKLLDKSLLLGISTAFIGFCDSVGLFDFYSDLSPLAERDDTVNYRILPLAIVPGYSYTLWNPIHRKIGIWPRTPIKAVWKAKLTSSESAPEH